MVRSVSLLLVFLALSLSAQEIPKGYYQFPIRPGQQNFLAGTVGEIRSSHFHTGIDVKTYGQIGLPVYAIAEGYIYRIKVSAGGYGNVLYMKHPNGTFSVYAHLEDFAKPIKDYILTLQYEEESFEIESFPKEFQFSFDQGEVIAYSGNTGSSSGPHLHFEIRNANNDPLDILRFGFDEIKDHQAPVIQKIAFVTLDEAARINGFFGRKEYFLKKEKNGYLLSEPLHLKGKVGIEIYSYDPMDEVPNRNGVYTTSLRINDSLYFSEQKDELSFGTQRNALVHYNYPARQMGSRRFNKLFLADGNNHNMYKKVNRGINFEGGEIISIEMKDSYENTSEVTLKVDKHETGVPIVPRKPFEVLDNFLHFTSSVPASVEMAGWFPLEPYNKAGGVGYFVWDLRKGIPTRLKINDETIDTHYVSTIPPGQGLSYVQKEFEAIFSQQTLFDTLYLRFQKTFDPGLDREYFHFMNAIDPLRASTTITLKTEKIYPEQAKAYAVFGMKTNFIGGEWTEKGLEFKTRDLVKYTILTDTLPPSVIPRFLSQKEIKIRITDSLSGIAEYRAEIDGEYILMKYEPKKDLIFTDPADPNIPFKGEFKLTVIDNSGNKTIYSNTL